MDVFYKMGLLQIGQIADFREKRLTICRMDPGKKTTVRQFGKTFLILSYNLLKCTGIGEIT